MKTLFPKNIGTYVKFFQAISDESRQKVLLLLDKGDLSVTDLAVRAQLSQSNTSKHLSVLKNAGLVKSLRKGNTIFYSIDKNWFSKCCGDFFCNFESLSLKGENKCK